MIMALQSKLYLIQNHKFSKRLMTVEESGFSQVFIWEILWKIKKTVDYIIIVVL